MIRAQLRMLGRLWRLNPPADLHWRVLRWFGALLAREFAWQFSVVWAIVLAALLLAGAPGSTPGLVVTIVAGVILAVELRFAWASAHSARAIGRELERIPGEPAASRFPRSHLILPPLMLVPRGVRKERGVVYRRDDSLKLRLDIYRPAAAQDGLRPAVVQVHGGGWISGSRLEQGIPLLNHLAANGWIGFNIDYRLSPRATLPDHVIDVKRAIAWVRENAAELGVDPQRICLTGGSAGGHLCALAALTAGDRELQPGFEDADTSVLAAVPFYGVYDMLDADEVHHPSIRGWLLSEVVLKRSREEDPDAFRAVSPTHRVHPGAPPFLIFHGEHDSLVPPADAHRFVERLEAASESEVLYVELPGGEHAFDLMPSLRTARVVEGIERFLRTVIEAPERSATDAQSPSELIASTI